MTTNTTDTIIAAIAESVLRGGQVTVTAESSGDYEAICDAMTVSCDDSTDAGERFEFWGTDEDGEAWHINVRRPRQMSDEFRDIED